MLMLMLMLMHVAASKETEIVRSTSVSLFRATFAVSMEISSLLQRRVVKSLQWVRHNPPIIVSAARKQSHLKWSVKEKY